VGKKEERREHSQSGGRGGLSFRTDSRACGRDLRACFSLLAVSSLIWVLACSGRLRAYFVCTGVVLWYST
jgi:hypothetical protein